MKKSSVFLAACITRFFESVSRLFCWLKGVKLAHVLGVSFVFLFIFIIVFRTADQIQPPLVAHAASATTTWTGLVDTDWYNVGNWDNGVPDATKDAKIVLDGGATVVAPGGGTIYFDTLILGGLVSVNNTLLLTGNVSGNNITIENKGILTQNNAVTETITGALTVKSGGVLTHTANTTSLAYEINFTANSMTVEAGGSVNANGKGYAGGAGHTMGNGPGPGLFGNSFYGGGGANGGNGGAGNGVVGGTRYCNLTSPSDLGSGGGGSNGGAGGAGGGLIVLNIAGTLTLDASISANGGTGGSYNMGGGAGGSMYITAGVVTTTLGTAPISTFNGGNGTNNSGGGGGGGCVRVFGSTGSDLFSAANFTVAGGTVPPGYSVGDVGRIAFRAGLVSPLSVTSISPVQTAGNIVTFTTTITDTVQTSLHVEYSLNNSTWADATLAAVTETSGEGTVTTSTGYVLGIDTELDGSVDLSVQWESSIDIPTTSSTVYLRITPSDGSITGATQTSAGFLDNVAVAWTGQASTLNWNDAGNWSNSLVPISTENVAIEPSTAVAVTASGSPIQFKTLTVGGKAGNANLILVGNIGTGVNIILKGDGLGKTGTLTQKNITTQTVSGDITIQNGGILTHTTNAAALAYSVNFSANNIYLQAGGSINANIVGYAGGNNNWNPGYGPGSGAASGGGANGGDGGTSIWSNLGGTAYCNISNPNDLGSGGGSGNVSGTGGFGGGMITLNVTSTFVIDAVITANGGSGSVNIGGGGGGTLNIRAKTITTTLGSAPIATFNGGDGTNNSGGDGGGGCVLVTYGTLNGLFTAGSFSVLNGPGSTGIAGVDGQVSLVAGSFNTAPTATAITPSQTSANLVTFTTTIADADSDVTSSTVEYSTDNLSWSDATLEAVTETSGEGTVTTSTGKIYSIDTNVDGSVNLSVVWNANADIPNTEDSTVYLRITPDDSSVDGTTVTSGAFAVDTKVPTASGDLTVGTLGTTTAQLIFGSAATDTNFSQYKIFYKLGASGVTTADTAWTIADDANLGFINYNAASASTLTGLSVNTQYAANIWAYDTNLRNTAASTEKTFYTLANAPGTSTTTVVSTTSLNVVIVQNSNPAVTTYAICTTANGTTCAAGSSYVQANGSLNTGAVWQDYATWGGALGQNVTGLSINTSYQFLVQAKNGDGTTTALSSASTALYTLANASGTPTTSAVSTTSLNVVIVENSNPSTVTYSMCTTTDTTSCDASGYVQANGSLNTSAVWQDYTTWGGLLGKNITGLSVNTSHQFLVRARNGNNVVTVFSSASAALYTLANAPGIPTVSALSTASINVIIAQNSNPSTVTYAICTTTNGTSCDASGFVQANDLLGSSAVWQSYATWGGVSGTTVTGLLAGTNYRFLVQAKNSDAVVTSYSTASAIATTFGGPGGGGWSSFVTDTPNQPLALTMNSGASSTNSRVVLLNLTAGSNVIGMALSRTSDFTNISQESYQYTRIWDLCPPTQTVCAPGTYSVYVKYFTSTGASNAPIQATITYAPVTPIAPPIEILPTPPPPVPPEIPVIPVPPFFQLPIIQILSRVGDIQTPTPPTPPVVQVPGFLFPKFLRNLSLGSRGTDVKALQIFLNTNGFIIAKTGAGSLGNETTYFGAATRLTLIKYQRAFIKEILGPQAILSQANGLFGPATRAYVNRLLVPLR